MRSVSAFASGLALLASASLLPVAAYAAGGTSALREFYRNYPTIQGRFEQQQYDDAGRELQGARGQFVIARPLRFRWDYEWPYKQTLVSDGKEFRLYDVDLAQVTVRPVQQALRGAPMRLLAEGGGLESEFVLTEEGVKNGLEWVRLIPRAKDSDFSKVRMGFAAGLPRRLELADRLGQTTVIKFIDIGSAKVDDARFRLQLPAGVEVVGPDPGPVDAKRRP